MICPACNNEMIVVEYHQIELDYCTSCKGVWFDHQELELLLKSHDLDKQNKNWEDMWHYPEVKVAEKKRKCPICKTKMKKINACDSSTIVVDACSKGHGLWFDGGEVIQLIKQQAACQVTTSETQHVFNFLNEVFTV